MISLVLQPPLSHNSAIITLHFTQNSLSHHTIGQRSHCQQWRPLPTESVDTPSMNLSTSGYLQTKKISSRASIAGQSLAEGNYASQDNQELNQPISRPPSARHDGSRPLGVAVRRGLPSPTTNPWRPCRANKHRPGQYSAHQYISSLAAESGRDGRNLHIRFPPRSREARVGLDMALHRPTDPLGAVLRCAGAPGDRHH